ncbi:MAG: hypothetical protein JNK87_38685 [Bryobacterales bacterium]|nr:hypothetical protein [Bryobacterales bacterium]
MLAACGLQAAPVAWTLSDVRFGDGASLTGYFVYDADQPIPAILTDFELTVSGGSVLPDFVYTPSNPLSQLQLYAYFYNGELVQRLNPFRRNPLAFQLLYLDPVTFLTNAGGTVALDLTRSNGQLSNGEVSYVTVPLLSGALVGSAASVPEPGSLSLAVMGVLALVPLALKNSASGQTVPPANSRRSDS